MKNAFNKLLAINTATHYLQIQSVRFYLEICSRHVHFKLTLNQEHFSSTSIQTEITTVTVVSKTPTANHISVIKQNLNLLWPQTNLPRFPITKALHLLCNVSFYTTQVAKAKIFIQASLEKLKAQNPLRSTNLTWCKIYSQKRHTELT